MMTVLWPNGGATQTPEAAGIRTTSEFGWRTHPVTGIRDTFHYGLDQIGWSIIIAPVSGVVSFAGYNGGAGNEIRIKDDNGDVFRLLHNRELWVRTGQRVSQGQQVAVMGTTGSSTGVHCHEETRPGGGSAINPRDYYASRNASTTTSPSVPKEDDMSMNTIRHPNGTIFFADDLGADHLGDYKSDDIGLGEFLEANARVFGKWDDLTAREFDIAVAIANRRWERKKAEIVAAVVAALKGQ